MKKKTFDLATDKKKASQVEALSMRLPISRKK
jgi:hypothetical protein